MPSAESIPPPSMPPATVDATEVLAHQRVNDPDFWVAVVCWALIVFSCLQVLLFSFGRDQSIYAMVGDGILQGRMPYRDVWDFKPPGVFLAYALAQAVFGKTMLAVRLLEVAGLLGVAFAFRRLAELVLEQRRVGDVAAAIAVFGHAQLEFWHTGQPEAFGGFLVVYAVLLAFGEPPGRRRFLQWGGVGALFGAAFLFKPTIAGGAFVAALVLARRELVRTGRSRSAALPLLVAGGASLLPIAACAAWFWLAGAWAELSWTMFVFTPGYSALFPYYTAAEAFYYALHEALFRFTPVVAVGFLAAISIRPLHSRERELLLVLLGIVAVNLAGVAMQNKFFQYHYSATLLLVSFISGVGIYKLWRRMLGAGAGGVTALVAFLLLVLGMRPIVHDLGDSFWARSARRLRYLAHPHSPEAQEALDRDLYRVADFVLDDDRAVALELQARVPEGAPIFVWGFEPAIYWLAERPAASRFIYDVPQRTEWQRDRSRATLLRDLAARPPAAIVVQSGDRFPRVTGDSLDSAAALATFPELLRLLREEFTYVGEVRSFGLYVRRTEAAP
ncbi:MAG TPA: glycosyltransferase family 39 protein [Polyangiaceae bacterium]|nr:glycosyltransferase family 39 protein [Polyangiaceae bacterium]